MTELRHYDNLNTIRFITVSCHKRMSLFRDDNVKSMFIEHLKQMRNKYQFKLLGFVIMPNHIHLVIYPMPGTKIGQMIGQLKSLSARQIIDYFKKNDNKILNELGIIRDKIRRYAFWERRCYDHNCHNEQTAIEKINYCHKNPVNVGLVSSPENWKWSSYNFYKNGKTDLIMIDSFDFGNPTASGGAPRLMKKLISPKKYDKVSLARDAYDKTN